VNINAQLGISKVNERATIEGIQKCFCMDIKRFERDSTRTSTTQN
jgi:hypothetical protein